MVTEAKLQMYRAAYQRRKNPGDYNPIKKMRKKCKSCGGKAVALFNRKFYCKDCYNVKKKKTRLVE